MSTVTMTAMAQPPSAPSSGQNRPKPPPPPPPGVRPPPPSKPPHESVLNAGNKRSSIAQDSASRKIQRTGHHESHDGVSGMHGARPEQKLWTPTLLRDVTVFQKKHQVGQGTYGSVFMGQDRETGEVVALKRINTEQEENGFPITAIREVKILKALNHVNIVKLKEIVTSKERDEIPKNVFMVFEYLEYDLTGILETPEVRLTQDHIKSWAQQLLSGVHYMHVNKIVHRDLKASNLLVNKLGELKIADWGLARSWNSDMKHLTNKVITLWYRPPELLLGCTGYSTKIDLWSVGCIIVEMMRRSGFLKGTNEASQLELIFNTCGHPTVESWPKINEMCPLWKNFEPKCGEKPLPSQLRQVLRQKLSNPAWMTDNAIYMLSKLLSLNPDQRWSASDALTCEYFFEHPLVKGASDLCMKFGVDSVHEWESRKKYEQRRAQQMSNTNRSAGAI